MFSLLLKNETPLVFHCSAGKDRTGVAAALILLALGVDEEQIKHDYLLSNKYRQEFIDEVAKRHNSSLEEAQSIGGVLIESLENVFSSIKEKYPNYNEFFKAEYDLGSSELRILKDKYTY